MSSNLTEGERRQMAELELRQLRNQFHDFTTLSLDWFFETDAHHRFSAFFGDAPADILAFQREAIGKTRWQVVEQDTIEENLGVWGRHMADIFSRLPIRNFEYCIVTPSGRKVWCELTARPQFDDRGVFRGYMGASRETTHHKSQRDALLDAVTIAKEANRAKTEFLSRMSHELRTPLNGVIGFADLLTGGYAGDLTNRQLKYVSLIRKAGFHLLGLIDEILDLSTIEGGRMRLETGPVDLGLLAEDCLAMTSSLHQAKALDIKMSVHKPAKPVIVQNDDRRLQQILLNLLSNAIKYNQPGGSVSVTIHPVKKGFVRMEIADTGRGIADSDLERIFEPFDRLGAENDAVDGTGIGLTITQRLVERMDGTISVMSKLNEGTTFFITLPKALESQETPKSD